MFTFPDQSKITAHTRDNKKIVENVKNNHYTDCESPTRQVKDLSKQTPYKTYKNAYCGTKLFSYLHGLSVSNLSYYGMMGLIGITGIIICYMLFSSESGDRSILDFFTYLFAPGVLRKLLSQPGSSVDMSVTLLSWGSIACIVACIWKATSCLVAGRGEMLVFLLASVIWLLPVVLLWAFWQFTFLWKLGWTICYFAFLWIAIVLHEL